MILWMVLACATPDVSAPAPAPPVAPPAAPTGQEDCMAMCMRANMARAVDHTVIEADCKAACSTEKGATLDTLQPL